MSQTREERIAAKRAALRNARAQESKGYDSPYTRDLQSFKPAEGKNRIRLMGVPGETNHSVTIHVHYGVGADRASYLCLNHNDDSITGGKGECPICAEQLKASLAASRMPEGAAKEEAKKEANGLRAKPRPMRGRRRLAPSNSRRRIVHRRRRSPRRSGWKCRRVAIG